MWNTDQPENYWWDRRVEKLTKDLEKGILEDQNDSKGELGVEDSYLSYKSMMPQHQNQVEKSISNNGDGVTPSRASVISVSNSKTSLNVSRRMGGNKNRQQYTSKNHLTSKDLAQDILNKSGVFSKIKKPNNVTRKGTFMTPLQSGLMNKSSILAKKSKSKPKPVSINC